MKDVDAGRTTVKKKVVVNFMVLVDESIWRPLKIPFFFVQDLIYEDMLR